MHSAFGMCDILLAFEIEYTFKSLCHGNNTLTFIAYRNTNSRIENMLLRTPFFLPNQQGNLLPIFFQLNERMFMYNDQSQEEKSKKYKATRPKSKRQKKSRVTISPKTKCSLSDWLGFGAYQTKFFSEFPLPYVDVNLAIVKDHSISCSPNYPAGSDNYFSENCITEGFSVL